MGKGRTIKPYDVNKNKKKKKILPPRKKKSVG